MKILIFLIIFLCYCIPTPASELSDYKNVKCIMHIHTDISTGTRVLESYIKEAKENGIEAVIFTDEDWQRWEYGLLPFRRLIKKVVQKKSVMAFGIQKYLNLIKQLNEKYKDIVIIDGVQTNPFYYWSGNFFKQTMALNNRNKDMLVIGLGNANAYKNMPLIMNYKSRFDAYHGDKFTQPYQDLIDYIIKQGGLIFWSHPEYEENTLKDGIRLITVPYHNDLVGTYNYTGFGVFMEGYEKIGKPGGVWDRILTEYCNKRRKYPVWAIGELEEAGLGNINLDDVVNVVYVKELSRQQILDSLKMGKYYVIFNSLKRAPLRLKEFRLSDEQSKKIATMGEKISFKTNPVIKISIAHEQPIDKQIKVRLIRNSKIMEEFSGNSQIEIEYEDKEVIEGQRYYYRIDVISQNGSQLISNPIFFKKI